VQSAPYTRRQEARVSWLSLKTKFDGLSVVWPQNHWDDLSVVWPQNHWDCFLQFDLKIGGDSFLWFDLKTSGDGFCRFGLKTNGFGFSGLDLKTGSCGLVVGPQNHRNSLLVWALKTSGLRFVDYASKPLRELKAHFILLGACITCPLLRSDLEASAIEIKDLKRRLDHASRYTVLTPLCVVCGSLKGKLFHATKENTELQ
jgi:hypothetical protein